jgi:hypothetical protein
MGASSAEGLWDHFEVISLLPATLCAANVQSGHHRLAADDAEHGEDAGTTQVIVWF